MGFPTIEAQAGGGGGSTPTPTALHKKQSPIRLTGDPVEDERKLRFHYWRVFVQALKSGGGSDTAVRLIAHGKVRPGYAARIKEECPLVLAASLGNEAVVVALLDKGFGAVHARSLVSAEQNGQRQKQRSGKPQRPGTLMSRTRAQSTFRSGSVPINVLQAPVLSKSTTRGKPCKGVTTPLHWACYKGTLGAVCALLKFGFDPGCFDSEGNTALHLAATGSHKGAGSAHVTILEILLSEGVDPAAHNLFGNTALQLATDERAKALLLRVMRGPPAAALASASGKDKDKDKNKDKNKDKKDAKDSKNVTKSNAPEVLELFSLSRIIAAETDLQEVLTTVLQQRREEEEMCARGWDLFAAEADAVGGVVSGGASIKVLHEEHKDDEEEGEEEEEEDDDDDYDDEEDNDDEKDDDDKEGEGAKATTAAKKKKMKTITKKKSITKTKTKKKKKKQKKEKNHGGGEVDDEEENAQWAKHTEREQDDDFATETERAEHEKERRKERTRKARTRVLRAVYERLRKHARQLSVAVATAKACFVKPKFVHVADAALRELKARLACERDMLHILHGSSQTAHNKLLASIRRGKSQHNPMPAHVVARASRVYLFLESRRRLAASVAQLSKVELSANIQPEQVRSLANQLASFTQRRILFGTAAKRRVERKLRLQLAAGDNGGADSTHGAGGRRGTRAKRTRVTRRAKKSTRKATNVKTKARNSGHEDDDDHGRAERNNQDDGDGDGDGDEDEDESVGGKTRQRRRGDDGGGGGGDDDDDDDDVLVRDAEKLLERLQLEVELVWCTNEDVAAKHKQGTPGRVRALEEVLVRMGSAFERCEALQLQRAALALGSKKHKGKSQGDDGAGSEDDNEGGDGDDEHSVVDTEIMAYAQARTKQLNRELKAAKRHFAEKNNAAQEQGKAEGAGGKDAAKKKNKRRR